MHLSIPLDICHLSLAAILAAAAGQVSAEPPAAIKSIAGHHHYYNTTTFNTTTFNATTINTTTKTTNTSIVSSVAATTAATAAAAAATTAKTPMVCNGYADLCHRSYGNITMVGAHNSPFVAMKDPAANQALPVEDQLDDGVRFIQGQMHYSDDDQQPHFCHTKCLIFDAGPITDWLGRVKAWVDAHPHDVVTILLGNGDYSALETFVPAIESTGIVEYAYVPPPHSTTMRRHEWPTLAEMIAMNKRVILFLDYHADEARYPWLLDEFAYLWETPMNPLAHHSLPCTVQRPPSLPADEARERLYIMNHNIDHEKELLGLKYALPAIDMLSQTNAAHGWGSLGYQAMYCHSVWNQTPTVLNVDYYNVGSYPGSVFQAAALMNHVKYEMGSCCGKKRAGQHLSAPIKKAKKNRSAAGGHLRVPYVMAMAVGLLNVAIQLVR